MTPTWAAVVRGIAARIEDVEPVVAALCRLAEAGNTEARRRLAG